MAGYLQGWHALVGCAAQWTSELCISELTVALNNRPLENTWEKK